MRNKLLIITGVVIGCLFGNNIYAQTPLAVEPSPELTLILNNFELIAHMEEKYSIRAIRVREHGECDGTPQSCPQEALYIAVSEYGEYPEQRVYVLPRAYRWYFDRWVAPPKGEGPDDFAVLRLKKEVISQDTSKRWWDLETYELRLNPWKAYIEYKSRSHPEPKENAKAATRNRAAPRHKKTSRGL